MDKFYTGAATLEYCNRKLMNDPAISKANKKALREFLRECSAQGLSKQRLRKYASNFYMLFKLAPEFNLKTATEKDLKDLMVKINNSHYAEWTKTDFKVAIKKYYKTMEGGDEYPKKVRWIKTTMKHNRKKLPEDMLSKEEIERLIKACSNERDRALISLLYEGGLRIGELHSLKIKHLKFSDYGVKVTIPEGKTGARVIPIIESERYLRNWLEVHPFKDPESPLWVKLEQNRGRPIAMNYATIRMMIRKKAKKAKIPQSKVNPHNFRHSRATELAKHLTEAQMSQYFGWVQGSDMAATYVHLSGRDLDKTIMKMHGLVEIKEDVESKKCPRCGRINPPKTKLCVQCLGPLDLKTALEIEEKRADADNLLVQLFQMPRVQKALAQSLDEIGGVEKLMEILKRDKWG